VELPNPVEGLAVTNDVDDEGDGAGTGRNLPLLPIPFDHAIDHLGDAEVSADLGDEGGGTDGFGAYSRRVHVAKTPSLQHFRIVRDTFAISCLVLQKIAGGENSSPARSEGAKCWLHVTLQERLQLFMQACPHKRHAAVV